MNKIPDIKINIKTSIREHTNIESTKDEGQELNKKSNDQISGIGNIDSSRNIFEEDNSAQCTSHNADSNDEKHISLLTEQIRELRAEYISIQSSFLTMTSISFCGYGLILYYAFELNTKLLRGSINYVFLCLPFLFGISFLNILKYTIRMLGMGAYIGHLEKTINSKVKKNIFAWHSKLVYLNGYNFVGVASIPCNLALFVVVLLKFLENMNKLKDVHQFVFYIIIVLAFIMIVIIVFSLIVSANQYHAVKYWSRRVYESDDEINTPHWIKIPPKDK